MRPGYPALSMGLLPYLNNFTNQDRAVCPRGLSAIAELLVCDVIPQMRNDVIPYLNNFTTFVCARFVSDS